jgi:hypothetical protein
MSRETSRQVSPKKQGSNSLLYEEEEKITSKNPQCSPMTNLRSAQKEGERVLNRLFSDNSSLRDI